MKPLHDEAELAKLIQEDTWMMEVLQAANDLNLPDWWIGAGFLRNKIWDYLEGNPDKYGTDVDLVYFNPENTTPEQDWHYDELMKEKFPSVEWEVRNQARMHTVNNNPPFSSTADGISHWVETATAVGVKLEEGELRFLFCYGTDDLFGIVARPTPYFRNQEKLKTFFERIQKKGWQERWKDLKVEASINVLDDGPFYHGTKADLKVGELLTAGFQSNYRPEVTMNHIYFTATANGAGLAAELAQGNEEPRVYLVEPTGEFENDPNVTDKKFPGNPTRSYRSKAPLKIIGEVTEWERLSPEQLQDWRDRLATVKGEIIN